MLDCILRNDVQSKYSSINKYLIECNMLQEWSLKDIGVISYLSLYLHHFVVVIIIIYLFHNSIIQGGPKK